MEWRDREGLFVQAFPKARVAATYMERIEKIPDWRNKLRQLIETWVETQEAQN